MSQLHGPDGKPIAWSDFYATLGLNDWAVDALVEETEVHDPTCATLPYALREDEGIPADSRSYFDCLLCRYTFFTDAIRRGHAHHIGTHSDFGDYAFCDCCWRKIKDDPEFLAEAEKTWREEGVVRTDGGPAA